ncbi:hypothetical protein HF998_08080, partial [Cellulomonas hominis]|nr:hypothetical protein [Cellulomonas hominis]
MRIRLIPLPDVTDADVAAWRRLAEDAAEPNLYLDPRFLVPARDRGPDAAAVQVLVVEDAGEWLAALAVTPRAVGGRVALRTTTTGGEFMASFASRSLRAYPSAPDASRAASAPARSPSRTAFSIST